MSDQHPVLEPPGEEFRRWVNLALDRIIPHVASLPNQPASNAENGAEVARSLMEQLPEAGQPIEQLLSTLFERAIPVSMNAAGPGYLAYIPGGGVLHAAVADLIAAAVNRYIGVWSVAPGLAQIEATVVRWFCEIIGYPANAGGFLTSGGSLANLSAVFAARRDRLPENFLSGTIYGSTQVHQSMERAVMLAGFPAANFRTIPTDDRFRIDLDLLRDQIERDRSKELTPFLIAGNAGTVNTGAVDDLGGLADVARDEDMWLHVDAAYGGFFALTHRGRQVMEGLARAHSVTLDPHKALFMPYGTGSLLVRDRDVLARAHATSGHYLPPPPETDEFVDFYQISPELTRPFRGLRVWLPIKMHGIEAFRSNLEEKLELTTWATRELRKIDRLEIVAEPQLTVVAFRLRPPNLEQEAVNAVNRRLLEAINARKRVYLTGTALDGRFVIRVCIVSFRTHLDRVRDCIEDIRRSVEEVTL